MEKEVEIYPFISFISELGESLGLFLGFSFMTIWDLIDYFVLRYDSVKLVSLYFSIQYIRDEKVMVKASK